jgi:hypothetical protein
MIIRILNVCSGIRKRCAKSKIHPVLLGFELIQSLAGALLTGKSITLF